MVATAALSLLVGLSAVTRAAASERDVQRLCVLDLNRLGDGDGLDWLQRGLADLLIVTLAERSEFEVLEREHLHAVLEEHELIVRGIVDPDTAARQARILRADVLLAGSFALLEGRLLVQTRLIRVSDQALMAEAAWEGRPEDVLEAPRELCDRLLGGLGVAPRGTGLPGFEARLPRTVDVAAAYYGGIGAFEDGDLPGALAGHLEGAGLGLEFLPVQRAVIRTYYLLGQGEHAVVFAADVARRLEAEGRLREGLEFAYAAAENAALLRDDPEAALSFLEGIVASAERHERETGEFAGVLDELERAFSGAAGPEERKRGEELRWRLARSLEQEGWWRQDDPEALGGDETGIVRAQKEPAVFVWRIRAQRDLARAYAWSGRLDESLASYGEILDACGPLHRLVEDGTGSDDVLRTEAHFMWLRHYVRTGELDREHALLDENPLNVVEDGRAFERDLSDPSVDPRARTASRYEHRGHEFFDFASPEGFQIDSLSLVAEIDGLAEFSVYVPEIEGWPPRYSCSRRVRKLPFVRPGTYRETISLPPGTEFVSVSTIWGSDPFPPMDALRALLGRPAGLPAHRDVRRWRASFELSPRAAEPEGVGPPAATAVDFREADKKLLEHHAWRGGWELGAVLRESTSRVVAGSAELRSEDWIASSLDGELLVHHRDLPLRAELPVAINTPQREFDPCLVRTHEHSWALLWSRGNDERSAQRFVALTTDFVRWEAPRRLRFAPPLDRAGPAPESTEELEGSTDVCPIPAGYLMLVERGLARHSADLRSWEAPLPVLDEDVWRSCLARTADGRSWAVCVTDSDVREPYTSADWLAGYSVVDGRRYKHMCELRVAASRDGFAWEEGGRAVLSGQSSGLWAFPLAPDVPDAGEGLGIAVQFNNRFMRWFAVSRSGELREISSSHSSLELQTDSGDAVFFVRDGRILSLRPVFDYFTEQRTVLLGAGSRRLFEDFVP